MTGHMDECAVRADELRAAARALNDPRNMLDLDQDAAVSVVFWLFERADAVEAGR